MRAEEQTLHLSVRSLVSLPRQAGEWQTMVGELRNRPLLVPGGVWGDLGCCSQNAKALR